MLYKYRNVAMNLTFNKEILSRYISNFTKKFAVNSRNESEYLKENRSIT